MAQDTDFLNMSDEDMMNQSAPEPAMVEPEPATETESVEETEPETEEAPEVEAEDDPSDAGTDVEVPETEEVKEETASVEKEEAKEVTAEVDYKQAYEQIFAPFKANGKEIKLESIEDAMTLIKMGANYNKKMAAIKPNLKLMKLLEENNLLSEEKIAFLVDVEKRNPQAINKLLKDSGIDPMDLDATKADEYKPNVRRVQDNEIELDEVLKDIEDTPTYARTLDVLGNQWDDTSKKEITNSPNLIRVINDHMQSGVFDLIQEKIESERVLGRLNGVSNIAAYKQIGDAIQAKNGFDHLFQKQGQPTPVPVARVAPKSTPADAERLKDKKRAASPTKPGTPTTVNKDFNPLALADDAFANLIKEKYL